MRYLITGHTGFKGSWLAMMLNASGATVSGISLDPVTGGLYERAHLTEIVDRDMRLDIRDRDDVIRSVADMRPEVVLHLAAQPLVRESYRDPRTTFETNVMGTLNILEAVANTPSVQALVIVTTDKVYRNVNQHAGYVESDPLGGHDPYSASKAMADILAQSWSASFPGVPTAVARAGNVVGGGDVSADRLLPDLFSSFERGVPPVLRYPGAVRPWQHVLDCLNGYLMLEAALRAGRGSGVWNFGPGPESFVPVADVVEQAASAWGSSTAWTLDDTDKPHEAGLLALDSSQATTRLGWRDRLPYPTSLEWTIEWHKRVGAAESPLDVTSDQIRRFNNLPH